MSYTDYLEAAMKKTEQELWAEKIKPTDNSFEKQYKLARRSPPNIGANLQMARAFTASSHFIISEISKGNPDAIALEPLLVDILQQIQPTNIIGEKGK